ncbi:MAG: ABC transporter permease [Dehalococcoidia bacterium]
MTKVFSKKQASDLNKYVISTRIYLLLAILFFDSIFGLRFNTGFFSIGNIINGDLLWIIQLFQAFFSSLFFIFLRAKSLNGLSRNILLACTPIILFIVVIFAANNLLKYNQDQAVFNFNFSSIFFSSLYWSAAYLSVAIGLTITYKVQRFGNFAQAEMMLIGSYVALIIMWSDRFYPISSAESDGKLDFSLIISASILAFLLTGLVGLLIDKSVYKPLRKKFASPQVLMITSLGVAMIIRAILYIRFSAKTFRFIPDKDWKLLESNINIPTFRIDLFIGKIESSNFLFLGNINNYGFTYTKLALVIGVFVTVLTIVLLIKKSIIGKKMLAVADNPDLASTSGINIEKIYSFSSFISSGIAGLGGALLSTILPINPELGISLLLPAFAVIVLGSIGSISGVIIASLIIGFVRSFSEPVLIGLGNSLDRPTASGLAEVMPFIFLIGVLIFLPQGLGNAIHKWNVNRQRNNISKKFKEIPKFSNLNPSSNFSIKKPNLVQFGVINSLFYRILPKINIFILKKKKYIKIPKLRINFFRNKIMDFNGSWKSFFFVLLILIILVILLPSVSSLTKVMQVARIFTLLGIFSLLSFSLNLHTGYTGMTNFGVVFFAGIGAVTVGLLTSPIATNGYGWNSFEASIFAIILSFIIGVFIAFPTARLRIDYFAIVTISLGEILRIALQAEPLLRAGTVTSGIGISNYSLPLKEWWNSGISSNIGSFLGLPGNAPYILLLSIISLLCMFFIWWILSLLLYSPWGRILKSIREDEDVSQHHGNNVLMQKALSLGLGASIAAIGGILWAWLNTAIWPDFLNPVRSTFLIWAAFILGGRGNNRGMFIGAFIIVLIEFIFNVMIVSRTNSDIFLHSITGYIDSIFRWIIVDVGGIFWSEISITESFLNGKIILELSYFKLFLIGLLIVVILRLLPKGIMPEIPYRPNRTKLRRNK